MTLGIMTLGIMTLGIMTLGIMTLGIMTIGINYHNSLVSYTQQDGTQYNDTQENFRIIYHSFTNALTY